MPVTLLSEWTQAKRVKVGAYRSGLIKSTLLKMLSVAIPQHSLSFSNKDFLEPSAENGVDNLIDKLNGVPFNAHQNY
jgi:hypothetical protein